MMRMTRFNFTGSLLAGIAVALVVISGQHGRIRAGFAAAHAESLPLSAIQPKLEALHEESKALLIKNAELKSKILTGLQAQNEAKIKLVKSSRLLAAPNTNTGGSSISSNQINTEQVQVNKTAKPDLKQRQQVATQTKILGQQNKNPIQMKQQQVPMATLTMKGNPSDPASKSMIDFGELEDFNKWVEINLEYAVKNTQASAEALKEEASQNNGTVDYSMQAIKDGMEGVKYWQSAIMFQDKTLKNEKFDSID